MAVYRRVFIALGERIGQFVPLALRHRDEAATATRRPDRLRSRRMTELHLLRHAHAGDPPPGTGPTRPGRSREKGERQADRLGRFLAGIGFAPDAIITSPKVRAAQTAEIVALHLGVPVGVDDAARRGRSSLDDLEAILAEPATRCGPSSSATTRTSASSLAALCGAAAIPMRKGAFARIDIERPLRAGRGHAALARCRRTCSSTTRPTSAPQAWPSATGAVRRALRGVGCADQPARDERARRSRPAGRPPRVARR